MIKAIETVYPWPNGPRYRSRLEARYAVFFDTLGIKYEYEKEGYQFRSGWYLPDFWLPDLRSWIEIKGKDPSDSELSLMYDLVGAQDGIGHIFCGLPGNEFGRSFCWDWGDSSGGQSAEIASYWTCCDLCGAVGIHLLDCRYLTFDSCASDPVEFCRCPASYKHRDHWRLQQAYTAARQARFEHGEHGR